MSIDRDALFEQHREWAAGVAREFTRRKLPPSFDPQDLEQEAIIACWKRTQLYDPETKVPFQAYAYVYVINAVRMAVRRRKWTDATALEVDPLTVDARPVGEAAIEEETARAARDQEICLQLAAVESALATLPAVEAYLVKRIYLDGVEAESIAVAWRESTARIKRRLSVAVMLLRRAVV